MSVFIVQGVYDFDGSEVLAIHMDGAVAVEVANKVNDEREFDVVTVSEWNTETQQSQMILELENPGPTAEELKQRATDTKRYYDDKALDLKRVYKDVCGDKWREKMASSCPDDYARLVAMGEDDDYHNNDQVVS